MSLPSLTNLAALAVDTCSNPPRAVAKASTDFGTIALYWYDNVHRTWRTKEHFNESDINFLARWATSNSVLSSDERARLQSLIDNRNEKLFLVTVIKTGRVALKDNVLTPYGADIRQGDVIYASRYRAITPHLSLYYFLVKANTSAEATGKIYEGPNTEHIMVATDSKFMDNNSITLCDNYKRSLVDRAVVEEIENKLAKYYGKS